MPVKISYKRRARCVCSRLELQSEWSKVSGVSPYTGLQVACIDLAM